MRKPPNLDVKQDFASKSNKSSCDILSVIIFLENKFFRGVWSKSDQIKAVLGQSRKVTGFFQTEL